MIYAMTLLVFAYTSSTVAAMLIAYVSPQIAAGYWILAFLTLPGYALYSSVKLFKVVSESPYHTWNPPVETFVAIPAVGFGLWLLWRSTPPGTITLVSGATLLYALVAIVLSKWIGSEAVLWPILPQVRFMEQ